MDGAARAMRQAEKSWQTNGPVHAFRELGDLPRRDTLRRVRAG